MLHYGLDKLYNQRKDKLLTDTTSLTEQEAQRTYPVHKSLQISYPTFLQIRELSTKTGKSFNHLANMLMTIGLQKVKEDQQTADFGA
jgi:hypothetical protein